LLSHGYPVFDLPVAKLDSWSRANRHKKSVVITKILTHLDTKDASTAPARLPPAQGVGIGARGGQLRGEAGPQGHRGTE
jgi:hypothetical protein